MVHQQRATGRRMLLGISLLALIALLLRFPPHFLLAEVTQNGQEKNHYPILGACGREVEPALFRWIPPEELGEGEDDVVDIWSREYHERVNTVVNEYLASDSKEEKIDCLSDSSEALLPMGEEAKRLAQELPPWKNPEDAEQLTYMDTSTVLLEYLRTYECALVGRYFYLIGDVLNEMSAVSEQQNIVLWWSNVFSEFQKQEGKIRHELAIARPALSRLFLLLSGYGRLKPLAMEVECFSRATMDFRNSLAAAAETSACFPRVWDTRDPLRDLKE